MAKKNAPPEFEQDWFAEPGKPTLSRLNKIIGLTEMRQSEKLANTTETPQEPIEMSKVYGYDNQEKKWKQVGYKCSECGKILREGRITEKHPLICKRTLKINKTDEDEILKLVRRYTDAS